MDENEISWALRVQDLLALLTPGTFEPTVVEFNSAIFADSSDRRIETFSRAFFNLIPARPVFFQLLSNFVLKITIFTKVEPKSIFVRALRSQLEEPNRPESCLFATYLVESGFITADILLDLLSDIFSNAQSLDNLQFGQLLHAIYRIRALLSKATQVKFAPVMAEFKLRADNIGIGVNLDDNADLYAELYQNFLDPPDNEIQSIINCFYSDNAEQLSSILHSNESFVNYSISSTLLLASSILSFSPPLVSVAAFFGAVNCVKLFASLHADLNEVDGEERTIVHFAAASGSIELLHFLRSVDGIDFSGSLKYSVEYWHIEAFNWLHREVFRSQVAVDPPLTPTALHAAAKVNNIRIVQLLLSLGHPIEVYDDVHFARIMFRFRE
jgi:hypothetical protein